MTKIRDAFEKYATDFLREEMEYQMELNESWSDHSDDPAPTWEERFLLQERKLISELPNTTHKPKQTSIIPKHTKQKG